MGFFRFRRTFRIGPGLRLNLSKSGVSASVGRRGLWFTAGPRGTRATVGIPGTGLSYTEQQRFGAAPAMRGDELGHPSEIPATIAGNSSAPPTAATIAVVSPYRVALALLALVVLAMLAIAIWA